MVVRPSAPSRSARSSWVVPKILRKSLVRKPPSFLAADAVIVFTQRLPRRRDPNISPANEKPESYGGGGVRGGVYPRSCDAIATAEYCVASCSPRLGEW